MADTATGKKILATAICLQTVLQINYIIWLTFVFLN